MTPRPVRGGGRTRHWKCVWAGYGRQVSNATSSMQLASDSNHARLPPRESESPEPPTDMLHFSAPLARAKKAVGRVAVGCLHQGSAPQAQQHRPARNPQPYAHSPLPENRSNLSKRLCSSCARLLRNSPTTTLHAQPGTFRQWEVVRRSSTEELLAEYLRRVTATDIHCQGTQPRESRQPKKPKQRPIHLCTNPETSRDIEHATPRERRQPKTPSSGEYIVLV